jgi:hypothetical protein
MPVRQAKSRRRAEPRRSESDTAPAASPCADEPAKAIVAGLQQLGAEMTAYAEHTRDQAMHLARSLIDAGSLGDVIALQQKFAQENFEALLNGSARVSEIGLWTGAILLGSAPPLHGGPASVAHGRLAEGTSNRLSSVCPSPPS